MKPHDLLDRRHAVKSAEGGGLRSAPCIKRRGQQKLVLVSKFTASSRGGGFCPPKSDCGAEIAGGEGGVVVELAAEKAAPFRKAAALLEIQAASCLRHILLFGTKGVSRETPFTCFKRQGRACFVRLFLQKGRVSRETFIRNADWHEHYLGVLSCWHKTPLVSRETQNNRRKSCFSCDFLLIFKKSYGII